jgi:hypothetical protein
MQCMWGRDLHSTTQHSTAQHGTAVAGLAARNQPIPAAACFPLFREPGASQIGWQLQDTQLAVHGADVTPASTA